MNNQVTFEGATLNDLQGQLNYVNNCLAHGMEEWERKEYEAVRKEYEFKINTIRSNPYFNA